MALLFPAPLKISIIARNLKAYRCSGDKQNAARRTSRRTVASMYLISTINHMLNNAFRSCSVMATTVCDGL